jgi:preprotein translocase subunit SecG
MSENVYWGLAALASAGIIYAGVTYYQPLLTALHVLVSLILLLVVLLQSGRAADLAGAFGGAGSQTAFGPRGAATFLSKATTFLAVVFMVTSLALAIFASSYQARSVVDEATPPATQQSERPQPAAPAPESAPAESPAETPPPPPQE